jgi:hypothetical protein
VFVRSLAIISCGNPARLRLVVTDPDDASSVDEVVLHVQGILCAKDLPPVKPIPRYAQCTLM